MRAMTFPSRFFLIALGIALPLAAMAQQAPSPVASVETPAQASQREADDAQVRQWYMWFNMLDTNHDGCVSREEAQTAIRDVPLLHLYAKKLMQNFDEAEAVRHSGCITPDDIRAVAARRRAERQAKRAAEAQQKAAAQAPSETASQDAPRPTPEPDPAP